MEETETGGAERGKDAHVRLPLLLVVDGGSEPPQRRRHRAPHHLRSPLHRLVRFRSPGPGVVARRSSPPIASCFVGLDWAGKHMFILGQNIRRPTADIVFS